MNLRRISIVRHRLRVVEMDDEGRLRLLGKTAGDP